MRQSAGWRYLGAALALGLIALWASENLFWSAPPEDLTAVGLVFMWSAYSLCAAAALSAVLWSGLRGWRALFLGGALMGWGIEGVVVATAYDAFPFQLVWTPLAWHALVSGWAVLGLCRAGPHWPLGRQVGGLVLLGLFGAYFAQYWPLERAVMPGFGLTLAYLAGMGLLVPLANVALDRLGRLAPPGARLLLVAPVLLTMLWVALTLATLNPLRLAVPLIIALTLWMMQRLGNGSAALQLLPQGQGPAPLWRHALFLLAPVLAAVLAVPGWQALAGHQANIGVALVTALVSLGLWLWLLAAAIRR